MIRDARRYKEGFLGDGMSEGLRMESLCGLERAFRLNLGVDYGEGSIAYIEADWPIGLPCYLQLLSRGPCPWD